MAGQANMYCAAAQPVQEFSLALPAQDSAPHGIRPATMGGEAAALGRLQVIIAAVVSLVFFVKPIVLGKAELLSRESIAKIKAESREVKTLTHHRPQSRLAGADSI